MAKQLTSFGFAAGMPVAICAGGVLLRDLSLSNDNTRVACAPDAVVPGRSANAGACEALFRDFITARIHLRTRNTEVGCLSAPALELFAGAAAFAMGRGVVQPLDNNHLQLTATDGTSRICVRHYTPSALTEMQRLRIDRNKMVLLDVSYWNEQPHNMSVGILRDGEWQNTVNAWNRIYGAVGTGSRYANWGVSAAKVVPGSCRKTSGRSS